jgi:hypothetical protein
MWLSAGMGAGWTRVNCGICVTERRLGPSGYLRVGTTLRPGLLLAVEGNGWSRDDEEISSGLFTAGATAQLYPHPDGGVFLRGGLAYVRYRGGDEDDDGDVAANLFGIVMGAGYEFPIAGSLYVTNYANLLTSSFGSLNSDRGATAANDVSLTLLQIGIGITRH